MRKKVSDEEVKGYWRGQRFSTDEEKQDIEEWQSLHAHNSDAFKFVINALDSPLTESLDNFLFDELMEIQSKFPLTSFLLKRHPEIVEQQRKYGTKKIIPFTWVRRGITQ